MLVHVGYRAVSRRSWRKFFKSAQDASAGPPRAGETRPSGPAPEKFEAGPSEEKGPPRESRRGEGGGGGSPPFFGCGQTVSAPRVDPLNSVSRFGHKSRGNDGSATVPDRADRRPLLLVRRARRDAPPP